MARNFPRLIGVIHLPPLPGAPGSYGTQASDCLTSAGFQAVEEAKLFQDAGFEAVILENFGDVPFYKTTVPPETVASMSIIAAALRETLEIPLGLNVLRNDARSALAIAAVTACDFIRVNVLSGVAATDQGMIEGDAATLLRERDRLSASVSLLADVHVKHAVTFSSTQIDLAIEELAARSMVDGVIVSGRTTGRLIDFDALKTASAAARELKIPLLLGSGATLEKLPVIAPWVDGMVVSSALRKGNRPGAPLEPKKVKEFARSFHSLGRKKLKSKKKS
ncbi:MAG: BtpA/SgcQ family protein [Bdellovibrionia bacterium]